MRKVIRNTLSRVKNLTIGFAWATSISIMLGVNFFSPVVQGVGLLLGALAVPIIRDLSQIRKEQDRPGITIEILHR